MKPVSNGKYSLKKFCETHKKFLKYSNNLLDKSRNSLKEKILYLTECQIWGDKYDDSIFDYFCENQILEEFFHLLTRKPHRDIIIQIIQSIGMLLYNLTKPTSINYLLSNNLINDFIGFDYDFIDEEILDYYISFLKSLALRMDSNPVQLFFNQKHNSFPLLAQAIRFFDHKENMVRTSVRNITLAIFKNPDPNIQTFLIDFPFANYFIELSQYLSEVWIEMNSLIEDYKSFSQKTRSLKDLSEENLDLLYYINDLFLLNNPNLNDFITNCLILAAFQPILLSSFTDFKKGVLSLNLALFLVPLILKKLEHPPLKTWLITSLFSQRTPAFNKEIDLNCLSSFELKEILGIIRKGKSPLEQEPKEQNPIRDIILSYLKSKDDNLILLMCGLLLNLPKEKQWLELPEKDVLEDVFSLITVEPAFRILTIRSLLKVVWQFGKLVRLKEIVSFNEIYVHAIYKLMEYIGNEVFAEFFLEIFEDEILELDTNYLEKSSEASLEDFFMENQEIFLEKGIRTNYIGKEEYSNFQKDIRLFLLFRHFRYNLNSKSQLPHKDLDLKSIYKEFRDTEGEGWKVDNEYYLSDRKLLSCYLKGKKTPLLIVEDLNNLILSNPSQGNKGIIFAKFRLKDIELVEINKYSPKTITIRDIKNLKRFNDSKEVLLSFEDEKEAKKAWDLIYKNRRDIKKLELALIMRILNQAESDLLPLKT